MVKVIVTSRSWDPILKKIAKLCVNPVLCIGAYIEGAVYSNSNISLKLMTSNAKGYAAIGLYCTQTMDL